MTSFYSEAGFFEAWQRGVAIGGQAYFGRGDKSSSAATSKWELPPRVDVIDQALGWLSSGEAIFLAAMVSFYNSDTGGEMFKRLGVSGLSDISAGLDEPRRRVIADLLVAYHGW